MKDFVMSIIFVTVCFSCNTKPKIIVTEVQLEEIKSEEVKQEPPPPVHSSVAKNKKAFTAPAGVRFSEWLTGICTTEHPGNNIIAYNFGIFETAEGYQVYLTGSKEYSDKSSDWAANEDFAPTFKYFELSSADFKNTGFDVVQQKVDEMIKDFMKTPTYQQSFFVRAKAITAGFDDGNLVKLQ